MSPEEWFKKQKESKMYGIVEDKENTFDVVQRPEHYNHNEHGIECIQAIQASMTAEAFKGYLKGNVEKYLWRFERKNGLEDLKKAQWYLNKLIAVTEK